MFAGSREVNFVDRGVQKFDVGRSGLGIQWLSRYVLNAAFRWLMGFSAPSLKKHARSIPKRAQNASRYEILVLSELIFQLYAERYAICMRRYCM